jgi:hypothetical protein
MIKLDNNYKLSLAKECTMLALQNNMIAKYSDSVDTAKEVAKFYKTLFENLDSETTE